MDARGPFAYSQSRLHARLGQHLSEAQWQGLESIASLGHFLQRARGTALHSWLYSIGQQSELHAIEQQFRHFLLTEIQAVVRWQPKAWRPAMAWLTLLVELPMLRQLLGEQDPAAWLRQDPDYRHLAYGRQAVRAQALAQSRFAELLGEGSPPQALWPHWWQHWLQHWPEEASAQQQAVLASLEGALPHVGGFQPLTGSHPGQLTQTLRLRLRHHTQQPVSAYLYLILTALELGRLRRALTRLWLLKQQEGAA